MVGWLKTAKAFWPECPAVVANDRRFLVVNSSRNLVVSYFECSAAL
jgi:hypothetical protein